jgi:hypothetical protein
LATTGEKPSPFGVERQGRSTAISALVRQPCATLHRAAVAVAEEALQQALLDAAPVRVRGEGVFGVGVGGRYTVTNNTVGYGLLAFGVPNFFTIAWIESIGDTLGCDFDSEEAVFRGPVTSRYDQSPGVPRLERTVGP